MNTKIELSVGEWKTRNGMKAVVEYEHKGMTYPWCGYVDGGPDLWTDGGHYYDDTINENKDIVGPWVSPIAPGHNPDKLTVEQVGDGWFTHEWDLLATMTELQRLKYLEFWSGSIHKWLHTKGSGKCAVDCTYRTRLTRDELLALIAPKKRLIRVEELPAVCWVRTDMKKYRPVMVSHMDTHDQTIRVGGEQDELLIEIISKCAWQWSSDLKTWHSFEVEDTK